MKLKFLIYSAICAALTAVCAQIAIPLAPVPVTLQVAAVFITGAILPKKYAFLSMVIYILLGAIGAPIFAKLGGGLGAIAGPTGGYIIAFPIMAYVVALCCEIAKKKRIVGAIIGMVLSLAICYLLGSFWLAKVLNKSFYDALKIGVIPYILFDFIKIAVTVPLSQLLYNAIKKAEIL